MNTDSGYTAEQVLGELGSTDNDVVRGAAFTAGDIGLVDAVPQLCELLQSDNVGVQEAAEYGLRKIRGQEVIEAMLPLLSSDETSIRNVAMDILREIAVDSIESLQPYLVGDDPDLRIFAADILGYCRSHKSAVMLGEALLHDPEVNVRYQAAVSLGNLRFAESVPALCQAMGDEEWVQFSVVEALAKIQDSSAIRALVDLLGHSSMLVSSAIIDALGELGDVTTIPMLFDALDHVASILRHKIVKAIVQILSGKSLTLLPENFQERLHTYLLEALGDDDEDIQEAALQGLSAIGGEEASEKIVANALTMNPDKNPDLYEAYIQTLADIGYNTVLRDALRSDDEDRVAVAMEVCQIMEDRNAIDELKNTFWRVGRDLQRAAVAEIAQLGTCDDVPFFLAVLDECNDAEVLKSAIVFFGNQHECPYVEDVVFSQLDHRYVDVKEMALDACINLHSASLNERFRERMSNEDPMQRTMAVYALGRYSVAENIDQISVALEDADAGVRKVAVEAFLNLGGPAERYLPRLLPRLFDEDKDVRVALVDLLGQISTSSVVPHLITALRDENDWVRIRAVEALGLSRVAEAVPMLTEMLDHASPMVSFKIVEALGRIGGKAAFGALLALMNNEDPEIQHAAAEAVSAISSGQE